MSSTAVEERIVAHGKNKDFTFDEYWKLYEKTCDAEDREDWGEVERLLAETPLDPEIAKCIKRAFGKEGVEMMHQFDLTDVKREFGEEWLND